MGPSTENAYRLIPAVDDVLADPRVVELARRVPREVLLGFLQAEFGAWRERISAGQLDANALGRELEEGVLVERLESRVESDARRGVQLAINATGVVLNTGLGRAPMHPEVARRMGAVAGSYATVELDRATGERNKRDERFSELAARATGAEAGIAVNNCAASVLLCLSTFSSELETVVSRGELVEIGGAFRVPDVMERANARLREVGTTNRTRLEDYRRVVGLETGLLMKVHRSNFRLVGFTEEVSAEDLAQLGADCGVATAFDLGSGLLETEGVSLAERLGDEPLVRASIAAGIDVVLFSGDKLLGGPQAGLCVGRRDAIDAMRQNPLYRALRLDKVSLSGLEATLELILAGRGDELPVRKMLARDVAELSTAAEHIRSELAGLAPLEVSVEEDSSQAGSGAAPGIPLPTRVVALRIAPSAAFGVDELASRLRNGDPAVFARVQRGAVVLDPRTLLDGDAAGVVAAVRNAVATG